ncbi:hypothetical protein DSLASN_14230 [Desulfoluna limicola]|uniref:Uncharacterized protein n=1 Tax=Desulfoluna limicola TaxID=2810562 RepID=A0ABM7PEY7_9BACT|nr:hypothetical protein [Desulfoluna limicola]BCS95791.1 hypothetical protein DSLASN_14230 [Desulfoluna limicola]
MATNGSSMNEELDSRLDELFEDDQPEKSESKAGPLENLQAVVLEMEWEIGDKNLDTYLGELKRVGEQFKQDKAISVYLKMLDTVGRYLKAKKASAHPETVSFLKSLYDSLEVAVESGMTDAEKNRAAAVQVSAFKRFKETIAAHGPAKSQASAPAPQPSGVAGAGLSEEMRVLIRQVVREEIVRMVKRK